MGYWVLQEWAGQEKPRWKSFWSIKYDAIKNKYKTKGGQCSQRESQRQEPQEGKDPQSPPGETSSPSECLHRTEGSKQKLEPKVYTKQRNMSREHS